MHAARYHALLGLKFNHENIAFANTTSATKFMFIVPSPKCNMYAIRALWKPCLCTMTHESVFGLTVV